MARQSSGKTNNMVSKLPLPASGERLNDLSMKFTMDLPSRQQGDMPLKNATHFTIVAISVVGFFFTML